MLQNEKTDQPDVQRMVENIVGCKWSLAVIDLLRNGINRPGEMVRSFDGLSTKVLNERLRKLVRFGIASKESFPEIPPRVEYELTSFGKKFVELLDMVARLEEERKKVEG
ncbi:MAG: helix-turn-helix transcriptional regulator [Ignavibacteriae bacterium]|nr:helix-turn-helix transcriptional regulator [Ignavibacteriota bacterium]MCB9215807.1 helix-turn-helix transcriptional regulator [Ignavibacteria bacterium]